MIKGGRSGVGVNPSGYTALNHPPQNEGSKPTPRGNTLARGSGTPPILIIVVVVVVAGPGKGKAGKAGPGQTKPRLGTTGKPAKPKQLCVPRRNIV